MLFIVITEYSQSGLAWLANLALSYYSKEKAGVSSTLVFLAFSIITLND
jgi:hypothetical protein